MTTIKDIPPGLLEMLSDFTLAVLRQRPRELHQFAAEYFNNLAAAKNNSFHTRSPPVPMYVIADDEDDVMAPTPKRVPKKEEGRYKRRQSICGESYNPENDENAEERTVYPKTDEQRQRLISAVGSILLFRSLDEEQMQGVIDAMFEKKIEAGCHVIEQGDDGDNFYVIQTGRFDVIQTQNNGEKKVVYQFVNKGYFGELALMYNMPR
jgi:cAMP-dependent protein kinase regulator